MARLMNGINASGPATIGLVRQRENASLFDTNANTSESLNDPDVPANQDIRMKNKFLVLLTLFLLTASVMANAELVQSTTGVYVSFRQCVEGVTLCDSITRTKLAKSAGIPGNSEAQASQEDPAYGVTSGNTKHTRAPGGAQIEASISALQGARNGSSGFVIEHYTNTSTGAESLTFSGKLTYDQTVPGANADFPAEGGSHSFAGAELEIFTLDVDALEAGTTVEENMAIFLDDPDQNVDYAMLKNVKSKGSENVTGSGTKTLSGTVVINPGDSVWMITILQSLGSNGAVVNASLETTTTIEKHIE